MECCREEAKDLYTRENISPLLSQTTDPKHYWTGLEIYFYDPEVIIISFLFACPKANMYVLS